MISMIQKFMRFLLYALFFAWTIFSALGRETCRPIYVQWQRVKISFAARGESPRPFSQCKLLCTGNEDPISSGTDLQCSGFNHRQGPNEYSHHCQIFQADQLQHVDGYFEADDRYSFYWKYCVNSDKICSGDYAFTYLSDRYMDSREVSRTVYLSSLEDCLGLCLNETGFSCRSMSFNRTDGGCQLSQHNQLSKPALIRVNNNPNYRIDYYENSCFNNSFVFDYECKNDGILVKVDAKHPYTGAMYGLYDFFTCRIEPHEADHIEYFFPSPMVSNNCSDSMRYKGSDIILEIVLSTDGVEPLYFITPDDLTYQARCPVKTMSGIDGSVDGKPKLNNNVNVDVDGLTASAHALFAMLFNKSVMTPSNHSNEKQNSSVKLTSIGDVAVDNSDSVNKNESRLPNSTEDLLKALINTTSTHGSNDDTNTTRNPTAHMHEIVTTSVAENAVDCNVLNVTISTTMDQPIPCGTATSIDSNNYSTDNMMTTADDFVSSPDEEENSSTTDLVTSSTANTNFNESRVQVQGSIQSVILYSGKAGQQSTSGETELHLRGETFASEMPSESTFSLETKLFTSTSLSSAQTQDHLINNLSESSSGNSIPLEPAATPSTASTEATIELESTSTSVESTEFDNLFTTSQHNYEESGSTPNDVSGTFSSIIQLTELLSAPSSTNQTDLITDLTNNYGKQSSPGAEDVIAEGSHQPEILLRNFTNTTLVSGNGSLMNASDELFPSLEKLVTKEEIEIDDSTDAETISSLGTTATRETDELQNSEETSAELDAETTGTTTIEIISTKDRESAFSSTTAESLTPKSSDIHTEEWKGTASTSDTEKEITASMSSSTSGSTTARSERRVPNEAIMFDIYHNGQPVEAVVLGSRITLSFIPYYAISPSHMSITGCQVEPISPLYEWEQEPLAIIKDGCQADHVGLVCPPQKTENGIRVTVESFRYQTTAHVQYSCLIRICPFAPCPVTKCDHVEGCPADDLLTRTIGLRTKRQITIDDIRAAIAANPDLQRQIQISSRIGNNSPKTSEMQQLINLGGDHVVKKRLVVVNSEEDLRYYVRTGEIP